MHDGIEIRQAIYELSRPENEWLTRIARTLIARHRLPLGLYVRRVGREGQPLDSGARLGVELPFDPDDFRRLASATSGAEERRQVCRPRPHVHTYSDLRDAEVTSLLGAPLREFMRRHRFVDWLILTAGDATHGCLLLAAPWPRRLDLSPPERDRWHRLAVHLTAAIRLRATNKPPPEQDQEPLTTDLWHGLLRGEWTLAESFDVDSRRVLMLQRNDGQSLRPALSEREREVLHHAARGSSNKLIAYHLDMSTSTAATHLKNGLRKLGVRTRVELIQLANQLMHDAPGSVGLGEEPSEVDFDELESALVTCARELARLVRNDRGPKADSADRLRIEQLRSTIQAFERMLSKIDD